LIHVLTDAELQNIPIGTEFVFDVECYPNFWMVLFKRVGEAEIVLFEISADCPVLHTQKLNWMLNRFKIIGFNSNGYDLPSIYYALRGASCEQLHMMGQDIIDNRLMPWIAGKKYGFDIPKHLAHIDVMNVCPLMGSLKLYGGRLHARKMQDLPIEPGTILTRDQAQQLKPYCYNDLELTELVYKELSGQLAMRERMSARYGINLMSSSDAQIAEKVLVAEVERRTGKKLVKPKMRPGESFYHVPYHKIHFQTPAVNSFFDHIKATRYSIDEEFKLKPHTADGKTLKVQIGRAVYKLGRGGIHSSEKTISHYAREGICLSDFDVASFYPRIIINHRLHPKHIPADEFLEAYEAIVDERLDAKEQSYSEDGTINMMFVETADGLKIVINGSFGKTGSKWSMLYDPEVLIAVTLSGQLYLMMLIERFESVGVQVISANTDGLVVKYQEVRRAEVLQIIKDFEAEWAFEMEETQYKSIHLKDVNNYIAIKPDGKIKGKGAFANPWNDKKAAIFRFHKNPKTTVCIEAVMEFLKSGKPIREFIYECKDVKKFIAVKNVKGGGQYRGRYIGKSVRWYYGKHEKGYISYCSNENKVCESDGAVPMMQLTDELPDDLNYDWYIDTCGQMLIHIGVNKPTRRVKLFKTEEDD